MLEKNDLKEIAKIVKSSETRLEGKIKDTETRLEGKIKNTQTRLEEKLKKTEAYLEDKIEFTVMQSEQRLESKIDKIDVRLTRVESEVIDVADNNREFLDELSKNLEKTDNHEIRIVKLEKKAKIAA